MRNQWYGDHRDIVKWGTLLHLAREHRIPRIIQIAYLTPDNSIPLIVTDLGESQVPTEVLHHFRNIRHISGLEALAGINIEVFDRPFAARTRDEYTAEVVRLIQKLDEGPAVVFLDPDTGISKNRTSAAHVTPGELSAIWAVLRQRDWLVLYQHASRKAGWAESRRGEFEAACAGARASQYCSRNGARDVAFFAASYNNGPA